MADLVDDIKSKLTIEGLVSQYVQLKKAGRNLKGLCPFHEEKTPSFVVSPEKQICHCFGCHKGGDIFTFIEEKEGITFVEALEVLADKVGIKADTKKYKKKAGPTDKDDYFKAHEIACEFFEKQLYKTNDGKKVLEYLYKRGLDDETIKEFRIGFAPDSYDALYPSLIKKGLNKNVLLKSGLVSSKRIASDQIYDKYRKRLIFPIFNYLGKICGFGGRALSKDQMPKYLNSPENAIYNKSKELYGLSFAKQSIKENDQLLVVEGYFDVILPYKAGIKNVVATSGTALTDKQAKIIKRLTSNVVSCFDNDDAGFNASTRAFSILQKEDVNMRTIVLDEKDPADLVLERGGDFLKEKISGSDNFMTVLMNKLVDTNDVNTLEGRKAVISGLMPFYKGMKSSVRDFFVRELSSKLDIKEQFIYDEIESFKLPYDHPAKIKAKSDLKKTKFDVDELVLGVFLEYPKVFGITNDLLDKNDFQEELKSVYKALADKYNSLRENCKDWDFDKGVLLKNKEKIDVLRLYADYKYSSFSEELLEIELGKLIDKMKKSTRISELRGIQKQIDEFEKAGDTKKVLELLEQQQELLSK